MMRKLLALLWLLFPCAALAQPPPPCPQIAEFAMKWCETFDDYAAGMGVGLGGCGTSVSGPLCTTTAVNTNSAVSLLGNSSITGQTLTTGFITDAALSNGMWIYDRIGGSHAAGNQNVNNETFVFWQNANGTYHLNISQTVGAEKMAAGYWEALAYVHTEQFVSMPNSMVVGENGGGVGANCTGNCTERTIDRGLRYNAVILDFQGWFADPTCGNCGWNVADFGFHRLSVWPTANNCGPCVRFARQNSPPGTDVNLDVYDANFTERGSVNITCCTWHHIRLETLITKAADKGYVKLFVDTVLVFSYFGANGGPPAIGDFADSVTFAGQFVGGNPIAEAYFDDVGVYTKSDSPGLTWIN